jgi:hypothetical protein
MSRQEVSFGIGQTPWQERIRKQYFFALNTTGKFIELLLQNTVFLTYGVGEPLNVGECPRG